MDKIVSFEIQYLESTNLRRFSKPQPIERLFIYFVSNVISSLLHEKYLKTFIHFIDNDLIFEESSHFKSTHQLDHKLVVIFVFEGEVWVLETPSGAIQAFLFRFHLLSVIRGLLFNQLSTRLHIEESSKLPEEISKNELGVDFGLARAR